MLTGSIRRYIVGLRSMTKITTLVKSNGLSSLKSVMEDFFNTDLFNKSFMTAENLPAVNISEDEDSYEIELSAPGFKKEGFKVVSHNHLLTISAETSSEHKERTKNYTRREFSMSSFSRSFALPEDAQENHVKANYNNDLLKITLKKSFKSLDTKKEINIE